MNPTALVLLTVGLVLLVGGAELLVRGASRLAAMVGVSPLIIGLTVVAFGTSSPELAVSVQSNLNGEAAISIGNVVGSNIFNVLFILGVSATITPLVVAQQLVRLDVPIMIGVSVLMLFFAMDGNLGFLDSLLLLTGAVVYTWFLFYQSRKTGDTSRIEDDLPDLTPRRRGMFSPWVFNGSLVVVGIALLILGARWLVDGAVAIALAVGLSNLVIGLTIVALGTSLPEVATSVVASLRGERDIAVGNVIGSNIFNILAVLGVAGIATPGGIDVSTAAINFDIPVMIAVAVACLPIFVTGNVINRWEGFVFLAYYIVYTAYLILDATNHESLPIFSAVVITFVIPLTVVTLVIISLRYLRKR
ncbi:MAG: calcium/sodium antiporter [Synechococcales bacterium]|nr:calcium/sodium antiporter [Synechococcales bacterium]